MELEVGRSLPGRLVLRQAPRLGDWKQLLSPRLVGGGWGGAEASKQGGAGPERSKGQKELGMTA